MAAQDPYGILLFQASRRPELLNTVALVRSMLESLCHPEAQHEAPASCFRYAGIKSMTWGRKLYSSPNGDRWYLIRNASGEICVRHEANLASGGNVAHLEIGTFLSSGHGPEQQELLRLIGTLLDDEATHL